jgi:hypothetical protein
MASAGYEPANLGTKGQHATSRPPKSLFLVVVVRPRTFQTTLVHGTEDEVSQTLAFESILQLGNGAIIRQTRILTSEAYSPKCQVSLASHTDPVPASNSWEAT